MGVTLTEFLLARIADEEQHLRDFLPGGINGTLAAIGGCDARRRIVTRYAYLAEHGDSADARWVLPLLALPYATHPDYRDEWRP